MNKHHINNIKPFSGGDVSSIRNYVLKVLKLLPSCNTFEFRQLGICAPAPRIFELRHVYHHQIDTVFEDVYDDAGVLHRQVARYVLKPAESGLES